MNNFPEYFQMWNICKNDNVSIKEKYYKKDNLNDYGYI